MVNKRSRVGEMDDRLTTPTQQKTNQAYKITQITIYSEVIAHRGIAIYNKYHVTRDL